MKLIKAGLSTLKAAQVVSKSEFVEGKMTGNVNFATPSPALADVTAARLALVAALKDATSGSHEAVARKNAAVKTLRDLLTQLARYVNSVAANDVDKAVSSGFELAKTPNPVDKLDAPLELEARRSAYTGCVDLRWDRVYGARMYQVYMCTGDPATSEWKVVGQCTATKFQAKGLDSDKFYAFKVSALGRIGVGPASEIAQAKAA
jgi:hypothetical protein